MSFYKGLGGLSGAALVGAPDVSTRHGAGGAGWAAPSSARRPRRWRPSSGCATGCLSWAEVVQWARAMTAALPAHVDVVPPVPHTGTFLLHAAGEADAVNERLTAYAEEHGLLLTSPWSPTDQAGRVRCEVAVGEGALGLDAVEVAAAIGALVEG